MNVEEMNKYEPPLCDKCNAPQEVDWFVTAAFNVRGEAEFTPGAPHCTWLKAALDARPCPGRTAVLRQHGL